MAGDPAGPDERRSMNLEENIAQLGEQLVEAETDREIEIIERKLRILQRLQSGA